VIGHFFAHAMGADLTRLIPRLRGAQFDWEDTVTLGYLRWAYVPLFTFKMFPL
jgi:hypothetical protein